MRCFVLWVFASAIPDTRGWFRPRPDRVETDVARSHNPSNREDEDLDTRVEVDANGIPGADEGEESSGFLETAEAVQMGSPPTYDMNTPAGYCVVDTGGLPLCCRRAHDECGKGIGVGGCLGIGGIGKACVKDCKQEEADFCFLVHSDGNGKHADIFTDPNKNKDIEIKANSPMALHVVWNDVDPDGDTMVEEENKDPSTLRSWTAWLRHVIPPLYKWLNPPVDPDPQMFWCLQQGMKHCTAHCLNNPDEPEKVGSGEKQCVPFIQSEPPSDPPVAPRWGNR